MLIFKTFISPLDGVTPLYEGTEINSATVNSGGNGYAIGDVFTINSGNELSICQVTASSSGVVTSFSILFSGFGYLVTNGLTTNNITGVGEGLTINVTVLHTRNTTFCHSVLGNDNNPGTRTLPIQTLTKASSIGYTTLAIGTFIENPYLFMTLILEGESYINGNVSINGATAIYNVSCKQLQPQYTSPLYYGKFDLVFDTGYGVPTMQHCLVTELHCTPATAGTHNFNTIFIARNYANDNYVATYQSCIFVNVVDLGRYRGTTLSNHLLFKYSLFRKRTMWYWGSTIIPITFGSDPSNYISDVLSSLINFANISLTGADKTYLLSLAATSFYSDLSTGQSNKVVDDNPLTGTPIFNKYSSDGNTPLDYSLSLSSNNVALTMGDPSLSYQYVGCFRTNIGGQNTSNPMVYGSTLNVNTDGTDDIVTVPNLLMLDSSGNFLMNQDSVQYWNRVRTNVLSYDRGKSSFGTGSLLSSAMGAGYYFGKKRKYDATHCVVETIEVLPYDSPTVPSAAPKFSMSFNGQTLVYYWVSGAKSGSPVLFSDLAGIGVIVDADFLAIYSAWAVSTADFESYTLSQFTSLIGAKQYPLTYFKGELNAHYKS